MKDKWFVDSGATSHMTNSKSLLTEIDNTSTYAAVSVGNGNQTPVHGVGDIRCSVKFDDTVENVKMSNVLWVPSLTCNLISVSRMRRSGLAIMFDTDANGQGVCLVTRSGSSELVLKGNECADGLYEVELSPGHDKPPRPSPRSAIAAISQREKQTIWHERLGHASGGVIQKTIPIVKGIDILKIDSIENCEDCLKGKSTRKVRFATPEIDKLSTKPLDLVHADLCGPTKHPSLSGAKYFVTFMMTRVHFPW